MEKIAVQKTAEHGMPSDASGLGHDPGEGGSGSSKPNTGGTRLKRSKQKCAGEKKSRASKTPSNTVARNVAMQSVQREEAPRATREPIIERMSAAVAFRIATRVLAVGRAGTGPQNQEKRGNNSLLEGKVIGKHSTFNIRSNKYYC